MENVKNFTIKLYRARREDKVSDKAAALAYYTLATFAPLVFLVIVVGGIIVGEGIAQQQIVLFFQDKFGDIAVPFFSSIFENLRNTGTGLVASLIAGIFVVKGVLDLFDFLSNSLFSIFKVEVADTKKIAVQGFMHGLYACLMSVFILLLLLTNTAVSLLFRYVDSVPLNVLPKYISAPLQAATALVVMSLLLQLLYRVFSKKKITRVQSFIGGFCAAVLLLVVNVFVGLYLSFSDILTIYGVSGFIVVLLLWVYYTGQVVFIGAEVAKLFSEK